MDIEDFLRNNIAVKEHTAESDPVNYLSSLTGTTYEAPNSEKKDNRIDHEREVGEWNTSYHSIWMNNDISTGESRIDITTA